MEINQLVIIVEKKIRDKINLETITIEDKSFLHKNHKNNEKNKYHLKISIKSENLKDVKKIDATKMIYSAISVEMKNYIHSIQLSINQ
ncbi:MAG: BolA family transcriptional regulator [Candidatus Pelagibacter sp. TMED275]|nr:MAG: BolA family transcriptional regulator [Candidatus Pelagibacter sp. TMED275]|tara:strand:- start:2079 stop:2342 length:264 start_codon:yes stop_codon:yes gene_type:complete